jgi:hypothetical protein
MARKGGRSAIIGVEVREGRDPVTGKLVHSFQVGSVDRVSPGSVGAARDRIASLMDTVAEVRPCVIVDVGTAQGIALHQALRGAYGESLHRPHAYPGGAPQREQLFAGFLQAYSAGRIQFLPGIKHRAELDKALVFHLGQGVKKEGFELESEDEALVLALGLALAWPKHGADAGSLVVASA